MVGGAVLAFGQTDIKRLFAYSSISQIGYIALGLGVGTPLAIFASIFHLFNHSIFKSLLFLNAGAIEKITGTRDLRSIRGVIAKSPVTGYTTLVGALSICGMPPFGGFWSKLFIILACVRADRPVLALIAALVSILTLGYYFRALSPALFGKESTVDAAQGGKISPFMAISMVALALISALGFFMLMPNIGGALMKQASATLSIGKLYADVLLGAFK
jgi:multicomponent Na+:H+ antiporter subunit D